MFFYIAKCLDDNDDDELEDVSKVTPTPTPMGADSSEISSTPIEETLETEPVEAAQDALMLLNACPATNPKTPLAGDDEQTESTDTSKNENPKTSSSEIRRTSHSWKGFKFKKQLSKVDMKIKNTFSTTDKLSKKNSSGSIFHVAASTQQPVVLDVPSEQSPEDESLVSDDGHIPEIREPSASETKLNEQCDMPNRPTDLNLFEDDKPSRPERRKDRKRFSLEKQTTRDTRLLSVPNIKYQHVAKDSKKSKSSNNPAFLGLIRRLSKFPRVHFSLSFNSLASITFGLSLFLLVRC